MAVWEGGLYQDVRALHQIVAICCLVGDFKIVGLGRNQSNSAGGILGDNWLFLLNGGRERADLRDGEVEGQAGAIVGNLRKFGDDGGLEAPSLNYEELRQGSAEHPSRDGFDVAAGWMVWVDGHGTTNSGAS